MIFSNMVCSFGIFFYMFSGRRTITLTLRRRTELSTFSKRCACIIAIICFIATLLVVVAGCRFAKLSLDQKTVFGDIDLACLQTFQHFGVLAVTTTKFHRPCFQLIAIAAKYRNPFIDGLYRFVRDSNQHFHFPRQQGHTDGQAGIPATFCIG